MALNPTYIRWAGGGIVTLGAAAKYLPYSSECQSAIKIGIENSIRAACGPFFGNGDLVLIAVMGGLVVILITFWKDIVQFVYDKTASSQ